MSPITHFFPEITRWPSGVRCSSHPLSHEVSLLPLASTLLLSRIVGRAVSSKFFDTQALSVSTKELVLSGHARSVFSLLCCNGHSFLLNSFSLEMEKLIVLRAVPVVIRSRTSHLILHSSYGIVMPLAFWRLLFSTISD